jgi:hypothetical protein
VYGIGGNGGGCGVVGKAVGALTAGVAGSAGTTGTYGVFGDGNSAGVGVWATGGSAAGGAAMHIEPQLAAPNPAPGGPLKDGDMWIVGPALFVQLNGLTKTVAFI